ncbi:ATP-dependent RNA helicase dbp2, partial [Coelomomyces lativittatus]
RYNDNYGSGGGYDRMGNMGNNLRAIEWSREALVPFEKNFYKEHVEVTSRSQAEMDLFRKENKMTVFGKDVPKPVKSFIEAGFPST